MVLEPFAGLSIFSRLNSTSSCLHPCIHSFVRIRARQFIGYLPDLLLLVSLFIGLIELN